MGNPGLQALSFVLGTLLDLYALVVAIRVVMQAVGASGFSPIAQFVIKVTDPLLQPIRKLVPNVKGINLAALLLCFLVLLIKALFFKVLHQSEWLANAQIPVYALAIPGLLVYSFVSLINLFFNIFIYSIIIMALLSWISPDPNNPVIEILHALTSPILRRVRRYIPPMGGLDLSSLAAIIGLYALKIIVVGTLVSILF